MDNTCFGLIIGLLTITISLLIVFLNKNNEVNILQQKLHDIQNNDKKTFYHVLREEIFKFEKSLKEIGALIDVEVDEINQLAENVEAKEYKRYINFLHGIEPIFKTYSLYIPSKLFKNFETLILNFKNIDITIEHSLNIDAVYMHEVSDERKKQEINFYESNKRLFKSLIKGVEKTIEDLKKQLT